MKRALASEILAVSSIAVISERGVMISRTSVFPNSRADWISSLSSSSKIPSSSPDVYVRLDLLFAWFFLFLLAVFQLVLSFLKQPQSRDQREADPME